VVLELEPVNCRSVVDEVATALRPVIEGKGLKFELVMPDEDLIVKADRRAVSQILINLMNNAIKFTESGFVRLEVKTLDGGAQGRVEFSVTDSGFGIKKKDLEKLFQAFEQIHGGGRRQFEGTGLGLHLSQQLALLLGGKIVCQSEFGKGSRFSLAL
jgi:protein-histidine pros-kinase